ncbi:hypothetical protein BABINDRAFT_163828 [Babjeviella inositovora NRRL Y-12698]|uniref:Protein NBA1 n=1 Tax=Babjeviella inositovora NRRL Y-12698 TaxID=984486 RepID=A0A1E3QHC4_9ASCO|nr:uncharacterized protein BABINDRAFT_163828 [Babjeviella inositovora NRRL Y-12698]ODQ77096.1 hypothetical protein BABINDRAFT_163828 [Babjeviella inositovora NRRL Y-12698]
MSEDSYPPNQDPVQIKLESDELIPEQSSTETPPLQLGKRPDQAPLPKEMSDAENSRDPPELIQTKTVSDSYKSILHLNHSQSDSQMKAPFLGISVDSDTVLPPPGFSSDGKLGKRNSGSFVKEHGNRDSMISQYSGVVEDLTEVPIQQIYGTGTPDPEGTVSKLTIVPSLSRNVSKLSTKETAPPVPFKAGQESVPEASSPNHKDTYTQTPRRSSLAASLDSSIQNYEEDGYAHLNDHGSEISSAYLLPRGLLPTLTVTRKQRIALTVSPDRTATTSLLPAIPPRSRQRPVSGVILSMLHLDTSVPDAFSPLHQKKYSEDSPVTSPLHRKTGRRDLQALPVEPVLLPPKQRGSTLVSPNESRFSTVSAADSFETAPTGSPKRINTPPAGSTRSLPQRPSPEKIAAARLASLDLEERLKASPESVSADQMLPVKRIQSVDYDDGFEDIPGQDERPGGVINAEKEAAIKQRSSGTVRRSKSVKVPKKKDFSVNRLMRILESTNGTLIGEEFESLDLPLKEKVLLEKIVDALSRLTADMVLDGSRFDEGCSRLQKALNALEGYT